MSEEVLQENAEHELAQRDEAGSAEERDRLSVRMSGDIAQQVKALAEHYGLPKAVISRVSMEVAMFPGGPSLEERLQQLAEERRMAEERKKTSAEQKVPAEHGPTESASTVASPLPADIEDAIRKLPEMLTIRIDALKTGMRPLADLPEIRSAVQELLVELRGGEETVGIAQKLEDSYILLQDIVQQQARVSGQASVPEMGGDDAATPSIDLDPVLEQLENLRGILSQIPEMLGNLTNAGASSAEVDLDRLASSLTDSLQGMVERSVHQAMSEAMQRFLSADADAAPAQVDFSPIQAEIQELRAQVQLLSQDLQGIIAPTGSTREQEDRMAKIESQLDRLGEGMDSLIREAGEGFYLQSNKPMGKLLLGKLMPVNSAGR